MFLRLTRTQVRKWIWASVLICLLYPCLSAQQTQEPPSVPNVSDTGEEQKVPLGEVYVGYSYAGADPFSLGQQTGLSGWEGALQINATRWLSLVADFSGDYGTVQLPVSVPTPFPPCPPLCPSSATSLDVNTHLYTYLFGANVPYRKFARLTPFAQALIGRAHVSGEIQGISEIDTETAFALGFGADYRISERLGWRVQADYLHTKFFHNVDDNYRLSTGITWHWTHKKKTRTLTTP
jgi:opacity protein-like surface antigen